MWDGRNEPHSALNITAGTLLSDVSEAKRHNRRRYSGRPPASHLGAFRRELLLYLAIREAHVRKYSQRRSVPAVGLYWKPADALLPGVELTPTLSAKISSALRALEELGYVQRNKGTNERARTTHVKVTRRGAIEAIGICERRGRSREAARRSEDRLFASWKPEELVDVAADLLKMMKEHGYFPAPQPTTAGRGLVVKLRAYCRSRPQDKRAREILLELENLIPIYRPSQEHMDVFLNGIADDAVKARWDKSLSENSDHLVWLLQYETFDLAMGMRLVEL